MANTKAATATPEQTAAMDAADQKTIGARQEVIANDVLAALKDGYEDVSQGEIEGWDIGTTVAGTFLGTKQGQYGPLIMLRTADGSRTFGTTAVLADRIAFLRAGDEVYIACCGIEPAKKPGQSGTKLFKVLRRAAK